MTTLYQSKISNCFGFQAKELGVARMTEDEFLDYIRKSNPNQLSKPESQFFGVSDEDDVEEVVEEKVEVKEEPKPIPTSPAKSRSSSKKRARADVDEVATEPESLPPPAKTVKVKSEGKLAEVNVEREPSKVDIKPVDVKKTPAPTTAVPPKPVVNKPAELMWVDKYKPISLKSVVGQAGDKSNANKLLKWLRNWFSFHGKSDEKVKAAWPGLRDPEGKTFKAALLSGPPGIGKTSTAHLCCKEVGYDYFELNASDTRNKKGLHDTLSPALSSEALMGFKQKSRKLIQN